MSNFMKFYQTLNYFSVQILRPPITCKKILSIHMRRFISSKISSTKIYKIKLTEPHRFVIVSGIIPFLKEKVEEKDSELITIIKRSILLIQKEEFDKAEQMLHLALKMSQEQNNYDGITYVYDVMANLAFDTGNWSKAQKLFVSVMQRLMTNGMDANNNKILHISLKLAKSYEMLKDMNKAEEGYRFCIENLEHRVLQDKDRSENTMLLRVMAYDYYALYLLAKNRLKEAFLNFHKACDTCIEVYGKEHEQVVMLLSDLGTVSKLMGDLDQAMAYFEEAVAIGGKLPRMDDLGSVYVNLGMTYLMKHMMTESERACTAGKRIAVRFKDRETEEDANDCLEEVRKAT